MRKHSQKKSIDNFQDSAITKKEANQIDGSSSLLSQLNSLNLSHLDQLRFYYEEFRNSGNLRACTNQINLAAKSHSKKTTNLICYGNVNGLQR